jgi:hypothetical protein
MNIRSESRYVWPDVEADDACNSPWSYGQHEVEVGYLASQLLLPRELPGYAPERSRFWQQVVRCLRYWPSSDCRGLRAVAGVASVARLRAQGALG